MSTNKHTPKQTDPPESKPDSNSQTLSSDALNQRVDDMDGLDELGAVGGGTVALNEEAIVVRYLKDNPAFFAQHPEVLLEIDVPHAESGDARSLIERQVEVLRARLSQLEQRFVEVVDHARDNESLQSRIHELIVQLSQIDRPTLDQSEVDGQESSALVFSTCIPAIEVELKKLFEIDHVSVRVFAGECAKDDEIVALRDRLSSSGSCVGNTTLPESVVELLFTDLDANIASHALLPIKLDDETIGVAALGATDSERFEPDQETTYLNRIADVLSLTVARLSVTAT